MLDYSWHDIDRDTYQLRLNAEIIRLCDEEELEIYEDELREIDAHEAMEYLACIGQYREDYDAENYRQSWVDARALVKPMQKDHSAVFITNIQNLEELKGWKKSSMHESGLAYGMVALVTKDEIKLVGRRY